MNINTNNTLSSLSTQETISSSQSAHSSASSETSISQVAKRSRENLNFEDLKNSISSKKKRGIFTLCFSGGNGNWESVCKVACKIFTPGEPKFAESLLIVDEIAEEDRELIVDAASLLFHDKDPIEAKFKIIQSLDQHLSLEQLLCIGKLAPVFHNFPACVGRTVLIEIFSHIDSSEYLRFATCFSKLTFSSVRRGDITTILLKLSAWNQGDRSRFLNYLEEKQEFLPKTKRAQMIVVLFNYVEVFGIQSLPQANRIVPEMLDIPPDVQQAQLKQLAPYLKQLFLFAEDITACNAILKALLQIPSAERESFFQFGFPILRSNALRPHIAQAIEHIYELFKHTDRNHNLEWVEQYYDFFAEQLDQHFLNAGKIRALAISLDWLVKKMQLTHPLVEKVDLMLAIADLATLNIQNTPAEEEAMMNVILAALSRIPSDERFGFFRFADLLLAELVNRPHIDRSIQQMYELFKLIPINEDFFLQNDYFTLFMSQLEQPLLDGKRMRAVTLKLNWLVTILQLPAHSPLVEKVNEMLLLTEPDLLRTSPNS